MAAGLKRFVLALTTGALLCVAAAHGADSKVLNIYNWSDYIAEDTIQNFEKETGIKVRYDTFDNNEIVHAKLVAGKTGYDIVVPGSHFAKTQIEGGLLQKLDRSKLTNWGNLDKGLLEQLAKLDPGNAYLVDWLWGYVTVGINVNKVKAALGGRRVAAVLLTHGEADSIQWFADQIRARLPRSKVIVPQPGETVEV